MLPNQDDMKEFVTRCGSDKFQGYVDQTIKDNIQKSNKWIRENREKFYQSQRKYDLSEKGKFANSKKQIIRFYRKILAQKNLTWEEKQKIKIFYKNCPKGYSVDHILPLSKGGLHELSNLQYLTHHENALKGTEIWQKIKQPN